MYSQKVVLWYCKYLWNYNTDRQEFSRQYLHNENLSGDAVLWLITYPRWRTAAILKIAKSPYLSLKSSDYDQIWYNTADIEPNDSHVINNCIFKNSRWRRPPSWKSRFLAITHRPIVRFQRNFVRGSRTACRQGLDDKNCNFLKFKMADGRHFENR